MSIPKPVVLVILDGWGVAPPSKSNAISQAKTPVFDRLVSMYPTMTLQAAGESVGLSWGEMGNSEVGHLGLGSGKIVYQSLPRLNKAITEGTFVQAPGLAEVFKHVQVDPKRRLHLLGMVSNGGVHSHQDHLYALLDACKSQGVSKVAVHAILDGRDTRRDGGKEFIEKLVAKIQEVGVGTIATLSGRFYAMDRDNHWDRIEAAYRAIAEGVGPTAEDPVAAIAASYAAGVYDEEFVPTVITSGGSPIATVSDGDVLVIFNYRADRARQITTAFAVPGFSKFKRTFDKDLLVATMMEYDKDLPVTVLFPPEHIVRPLAKILSEQGMQQLHVAETEKYAHVTFFFNGGAEEAFPGEDRVLVPSAGIPSYAQKPEMSAPAIAETVSAAVAKGKYDFIVVNFANPDMVGHTGDLEATIKAVEVTDACIGQIVDATLAVHGIVLITADHGNAEELLNLQTQAIDKEHSTNPVPLLMVGEAWAGQASPSGEPSRDLSLLTPAGMLADVSPTILKLMELPAEPEMTGSTLI